MLEKAEQLFTCRPADKCQVHELYLGRNKLKSLSKDLLKGIAKGLQRFDATYNEIHEYPRGTFNELASESAVVWVLSYYFHSSAYEN